MNLPVFLIFIILILLNLYKADDSGVSNNVMNCTISNWTNSAVGDILMNCSNLNFTDCPEFNSTITFLILDFNALTSLSTPNCLKWHLIKNLSIRYNGLTSLAIPEEFQFLQQIYLSYNSIKEIVLSSSYLVTIDISYNSLKNISLGKLIYLKTLNVSHNQIDNEFMGVMVKSLLASNAISFLDLSYNHIDHLSPYFINFKSNNLDFMSFAGNEFTEFNFVTLNQNLLRQYRLDLSNNKIGNILIDNSQHISALNLSGNNLSKIDGNMLNRFEGLKQIDLSRNPWNCLCNESRSFINWMKLHADIVVNKNETLCKIPSRQPVFWLSCDDSSTTGPSTPTKPFSTTSTRRTISTKKPVGNGTNIQAAVGISVAIFIILIIGCSGFLLYKRRINERQGYLPINESAQPNASFFCDCIPLIRLRRSNQRTPLLINPSDMADPIDNHHLNFGSVLNVICCLRCTPWVTSNVTSHLNITSQIINGTMKQLPYADYTLIVVNGNSCLENANFVKNAELAVQALDKSEIKLLIVDTPNLESRKTKNSLTRFIASAINKGQHFRCSMDAVCVDDMKLWLSLAMNPHNV